MRELHFKKTQTLYELREKEKCVTAEIDGRRGQLKNLICRLRRVDADTLKQQEIMYKQAREFCECVYTKTTKDM